MQLPLATDRKKICLSVLQGDDTGILGISVLFHVVFL